jgi:hypothetical protein
MPTTRNVHRPNGIVSPARQLEAALESVGGSSGLAVFGLKLEQKAIRSAPYLETDGWAEHIALANEVRAGQLG